MLSRTISLLTLLLPAALLAAQPANAPLTREFLDRSLAPPKVITQPGPEYQDGARTGGMIIGMDRTPKGRIWACWTGTGDNPEAYFILGSSDDGGRTWSRPQLVVDSQDPPSPLRRCLLVGNLWTDPKGRLWLFFNQALGMFDGRNGDWFIRCDNPDADAPAWSKPVRFADGCTLNKPTVLRNGDWLLPVSLWTRDRISAAPLKAAYPDLDPQRMAHVFVSTDQGGTWTRRGGVVFPETDFDEHMIVELRDGRLWMLARTKRGMGESFSSDNGRTWTEPKPSTIQNVSARFFIRRLASGRLLLVKNGPTTERLRQRSHMSAFLSADDGRTWQGGLLLDDRASVSYPDGFQAPDGLIHILYDWNRHTDAEILMAQFREEDILAGQPVSPDAKLRLLVNKARAVTLYNGIVLPAVWPPRSLDPMSAKPVPVPWLATPPKVIPINVGRQLFVDDFLIERTTLKRNWHQPEKFAGNPILKPETPLERQNGLCPMAAPFSDGVFFDAKDRLFKMWYQAGWFDGTAYATSTDGIHWQRPLLDVAPPTNRILPDREEMRRDGVSLWLDHGAKDPLERFKMFLYTRQGQIGHELHGGKGHLLSSPDGIHWTFRGATGALGDNSTFFYNPFRQKWVFSIRSGFSKPARLSRTRSYWECDDFINSPKWGASQPVFWAATDELDQPDPVIGDAPQLYKVDAVAYESLMLGLFEIFAGPANEKCARAGTPKITDLQLAFSRDGFHWDRPHRQAFIAASRKPGDWERGYISSAGGGCLIVGDKLHFYYGAFQGDESHQGGIGHWSGMYANAATGLAILRRDGFASLDAAEEPGMLTTRPLTFRGKFLYVNVDCPKGELRAEVLDEFGSVVEPFSIANCIPLRCDRTAQRVTWRGADSLAPVRGKRVRLRFQLTRGSLYSFWVTPDASGASHGYVAAGGPGFAASTDTVGMNATHPRATPQSTTPPLKP